jgi:hypothetical protein
MKRCPASGSLPASAIACSSARACAAASRESIASHNAASTCAIRSTTVATAPIMPQPGTTGGNPHPDSAPARALHWPFGAST